MANKHENCTYHHMPNTGHHATHNKSLATLCMTNSYQLQCGSDKQCILTGQRNTRCIRTQTDRQRGVGKLW